MIKSTFLSYFICCIFLLSTKAEVYAQKKNNTSNTIKYLYIISSAHNDVGFDYPPSIMAEHSVRDIDEAIAIAKEEDIPGVVWTIETFWQIREWLNVKTDAEQKELIDLIKANRIAFSGAYICPHASFLNDYLMDQNYRIPTQWANKNGIPVDWVMQNDVPDHHPAYPKFMAQNGIKYFMLGANQRFNPNFPEKYSNTPFWWASKDGRDSVLTFICGESYNGSFQFYGMNPNAAKFFNKKEYPELKEMKPLEVARFFIDKKMAEFRDRDYPYDAIAAIHSMDDWGTKNIVKLQEGVELWNKNRREGDLEIIVSSPREFFTHLETTYGEQLPTYKGGNPSIWGAVRRRNPVLTLQSIEQSRLFQQQENPNQKEVEKMLTFYGHTDAFGGYTSKQMSKELAQKHYNEFFDFSNYWLSADAIIKSWPQGKPTSLIQPEHKKYKHNGLYLKQTGDDGKSTMKLLKKDVLVKSSVERISDNHIIVKFKIDRHKLNPKTKNSIFWYWHMEIKNIGKPVDIEHAGGTWRFKEENLGIVTSNFFAPFEFTIGTEQFIPHGPFSFSQKLSGRYLCAQVLDQHLKGKFVDDKKETYSEFLTWDEAMPRAEQYYEFAIEIITHK